MLGLVVPVDGSPPSLRAVNCALKLWTEKSESELHLLNVQVPLPAAMADFLNPVDVRNSHMDEGAVRQRGEYSSQVIAHMKHVNMSGEPLRKIDGDRRGRFESSDLIGQYKECLDHREPFFHQSLAPSGRPLSA